MARKARIRRAEAPAGATSSQQREPRQSALPESIGRYARAIAIAAVLLATARIAATYRAFSHTLDQPAHIAAGIEWPDTKTSPWQPQHPPLARVAAPLGPYLLGARSIDAPKTDDIDKRLREGTNILYRGGYD